MKLVINCDDLALTYGTTNGIQKCLKYGLSKSASILVNGTAFDYTTKLIKSGNFGGVGFGIHLNLTDGPAFSKELADNRGNYKYDFISILKETVTNKKIIGSISEDFEKQIQKLLSTKIPIDHIDSDKHVHMIPKVFEIAAALAAKYKIPYIRISREPFYLKSSDKRYPFTGSLNIIKKSVLDIFSTLNISTARRYQLKYTDSVYGILYSNRMVTSSIMAGINDGLKRNYKIIEILTHPGFPKDQRDTKYISQYMEKYSQEKHRSLEMKTLLNPKLKRFLKLKNVSLNKFPEL
jgi:predicted glycoside hydrolase/deacetylase ChbG (UPF0249 family)